MANISRYFLAFNVGELIAHPLGGWVKHADHAAIVTEAEAGARALKIREESATRNMERLQKDFADHIKRSDAQIAALRDQLDRPCKGCGQ